MSTARLKLRHRVYAIPRPRGNAIAGRSLFSRGTNRRSKRLQLQRTPPDAPHLRRCDAQKWVVDLASVRRFSAVREWPASSIVKDVSTSLNLTNKSRVFPIYRRSTRRSLLSELS